MSKSIRSVLISFRLDLDQSAFVCDLWLIYSVDIPNDQIADSDERKVCSCNNGTNCESELVSFHKGDSKQFVTRSDLEK